MKKGWLIAGAVVGCLSGASLGACGSGGSGTTSAGSGGTTGPSGSTTTTSTTGSPTASTTTTATTSTSGTGGTTGTGMGGMTGTGGSPVDAGTCSKVTTLHPPSLDAGPGTIYCPFSGVDGGKAEYCTPTTEHCCETAAGSPTPSACQTAATMCGATDTDWECEDPVSDCASGMDCCATSKAGKTSSIGLGAPGCGNFAHQMIGTKCQAAGSCTGIKMCTSDAECTAPQVCTPFGKAGNQVGGCM